MSDSRCNICGQWKWQTQSHTCPPAWTAYIHGEDYTKRTAYARDAEDAAVQFVKDRCNEDCECFSVDDFVDVVVAPLGERAEPVVFRVNMSLEWSFKTENYRGIPLETFDPEEV